MSIPDYVINREAWQALIDTHPELKVHMVVHGEAMLSLPVLSPVLPLASLTWERCLYFKAESEVGLKLNCNSFKIKQTRKNKVFDYKSLISKT